MSDDEIRKKLTTDFLKKNKLVCFAHLQKTGGTSLNGWLKGKFFQKESVYAVDTPGGISFNKGWRTVLDYAAVISGHAVYDGTLRAAAIKETLNLTVIRRPSSRTISDFNFSMLRANTPSSFFDYYPKIGLNYQSTELMRRFPCLVPREEVSMTTRIERLLDNFDVVLCAEDLGAFFKALASKAGYEVQNHDRANISGGKFLELSEAELERIDSENYCDLYIWQKYQGKVEEAIDLFSDFVFADGKPKDVKYYI